MKDFAELVLPAELRYTKDHEWISPAAPFRIGISDFAQDRLGDLTFVELPGVGTVLAKGDELGTVESIKSVSSVYSPVSGTVVAVNDALAGDPGKVNSDPYGEGWLVAIEPGDVAEFASLMQVDAYRRHIKDDA